MTRPHMRQPRSIRVQLVAACDECRRETKYAGAVWTDVDHDIHAAVPVAWKLLRRGEEELACCSGCALKMLSEGKGWRAIDDLDLVIS